MKPLSLFPCYAVLHREKIWNNSRKKARVYSVDCFEMHRHLFIRKIRLEGEVFLDIHQTAGGLSLFCLIGERSSIASIRSCCSRSGEIYCLGTENIKKLSREHREELDTLRFLPVSRHYSGSPVEPIFCPALRASVADCVGKSSVALWLLIFVLSWVYKIRVHEVLIASLRILTFIHFSSSHAFIIFSIAYRNYY